MAFLSDMFTELAARRRRLRAALGDRGGDLIEFLLIGGLTCGAIAAFFFREWRGLAPLGAAFAGYLLLEARRQRALATGADEARTRKAQDRLVLMLLAALAVLGAAIFIHQNLLLGRAWQTPLPNEEFNVDIEASPS